ncbi:hypothetical protein ACFLTZ_06445, partial [Chloroflexota bacterium]
KRREGSMTGLKVLRMIEFITSHILLVGGLVLITIGIIQGSTTAGTVLIIVGIWAFALGLCVTFSAAFKKLHARKR